MFFVIPPHKCFSQISGASVDETLSGDVIQSILKVTVNKPALYTCLASNRHSAGVNTVKATARVTVAGMFPETPHNSMKLCGLCVFGVLTVVWLQLFVAS